MNILNNDFCQSIMHFSNILERSGVKYSQIFTVYQDTFELYCEKAPVFKIEQEKSQVIYTRENLTIPVKREVKFHLLPRKLGVLFTNRIYLPISNDLLICSSIHNYSDWFIEWDQIYIYQLGLYKSYDTNYRSILETGNLFKKDDPYETRRSIFNWLTKENMKGHMIATIDGQKIVNNIELLAIEYL